MTEEQKQTGHSHKISTYQNKMRQQQQTDSKEVTRFQIKLEQQEAHIEALEHSKRTPREKQLGQWMGRGYAYSDLQSSRIFQPLRP